MQRRGEAVTKIEAFENSLIINGLSEEAYAEYEKHLKRVPGNYLRLQHCYCTAFQFPIERSQEGADLIRWGIEKYPDTWYSMYMAHWSIGGLYERCGNYTCAYKAYLDAAGYLCEDDRRANRYLRLLSGDLLWMLLHIDSFRYSELLERYYNSFKENDQFTLSFINSEYRIAVAEIVIFKHKGMQGEAITAYEKAVQLSQPDFISRVQGVLDKHRAKDRLIATPESVAFLKAESPGMTV